MCKFYVGLVCQALTPGISDWTECEILAPYRGPRDVVAWECNVPEHTNPMGDTIWYIEQKYMRRYPSEDALVSFDDIMAGLTDKIVEKVE